MEKKYRLITKSNLDGIVAAILLDALSLIHDVTFVSEDDFKAQKISTNANDITVNLPFTTGIHQAFDYHDSSTSAIMINKNHIYDTTLSSAAALLYSHYHDRLKEREELKELVNIANKESQHTLTTKERLYVYRHYKTTFNKQLAEA